MTTVMERAENARKVIGLMLELGVGLSEVVALDLLACYDDEAGENALSWNSQEALALLMDGYHLSDSLPSMGEYAFQADIDYLRDTLERIGYPMPDPENAHLYDGSEA